MTKDTDEIKKFFDSWNIYRKAVDSNYLKHKEVISILQSFIRENCSPGYSMLDLGCGDSHIPSQVVNETNITHYHGIDLSPIALGLAKQKMESIPCEKHFVAGNILEEINNLKISYDIILASASISHFELKQKEKLLEKIKLRLNPGGFFLMFDIIRKDHETREAYIQRLLDYSKINWTELKGKEFSLIFNHISNYDIPESFEIFQETGQKVGFRKITSLFQDKKHLYRLLCFSV